MKRNDKSFSAKHDESAKAGPSATGKPSRAKRSKPARRPSFAAFLRAIPPGDASDERDFARIQ